MKFKLRGHFTVEHYRKGKLLDKYEMDNGIVTVGFNALLNIMFEAATQIATWYVGLIDNSGFTALQSTDTMASNGVGWTELTAYSQATRPAYTPVAAANQQITSNAVTQFSINATKSVKGMFLTSSNTKGGTTGTLWCTALFDSVKPVANGDTFKVIYTLSVA